MASVIREVQEETGLTVSNLQNCGYIQWYNPVKQSQYFVFLFKTSTFSGELTGSVEGNVKWMTLERYHTPAGCYRFGRRRGIWSCWERVFLQAFQGKGLNLIDNNGKSTDMEVTNG